MSTAAKPGTKATPPALGVPTAPPLPEDVEALLRRLRLPHIRRHAPEVVATAKAQRWEPVEVLRALLGQEAIGRERSAIATRRAAAGFPTGKTFEAWTPQAPSIPARLVAKEESSLDVRRPLDDRQIDLVVDALDSERDVRPLHLKGLWVEFEPLPADLHRVLRQVQSDGRRHIGDDARLREVLLGLRRQVLDGRGLLP